MFASSSTKFMIVGACAIVCIAIVVRAQYNAFDSDPNSELGKLVRNSGKLQTQQNQRHQFSQQQAAAATRNLLNQQPQQPFQFSSNQNRRNYGSASPLNSYDRPMGAAASGGRGQSSELSDDDESSNFGPNFNFDSNSDAEGESANGQANADGQVTGLNQAASGYPGQADFSNEAVGAGSSFNFDGPSGYGPSSVDGSDFGPSDGFNGEGKRAKSASSPMSTRNFGGPEEDSGASQYGPNSAVNSDADETESRAANYPSNANGNSQADNENDNDDE